ncbi:SAM-dependent methyltransferase [Helicobacter didelphidarum]|uniref:SAM-dependent methyltransferase n=1 Tax=Helicobacter didelphidarum TaxID=2040648 RepID=A0A3D8IBP1_9HELI|nr:rRNA adenine N-6-methyltransferase family protein [Helicobacter didelphidarum]RDU61971.1 SAM-dependent methyltransferase [Helicobacter didelphidarum]
MLLYFLRNPRRIGTLCSSSKELSCAITNNIGLENAQYIAEIGPGLGVFTQEILRKKNKNAQFFAIEINTKIAKKLQEKLMDVEVENESAEKLLQIMKRKQIEYLDVIVSGLPWSVFSQKEQDCLLDCIHEGLRDNGCFATFAYIFPTPQAKKFKKKLFKYFKNVRISKIIWNNFPPAYVYYCKK